MREDRWGAFSILTAGQPIPTFCFGEKGMFQNPLSFTAFGNPYNDGKFMFLFFETGKAIYMKNNKHIFYPLMASLFGVLTIAIFIGCDGEDEPVPAYIQINNFVVEATNPNLHGSISDKITDATVFLIDRNSTDQSHSLGTITLPATIPAILTGDYEINIDPVVRTAGNSLYLEVYPFYSRYSADISLSPNGDVEITPKTSYVPEAKFIVLENFEAGGHLFQTDRDDDPDTFIDISEEDVFEGNSSGKVRLDTAHNVFVAANAAPYDVEFPEAGRAFMEVNYKTDVPLEFGVLAVDALNDETPNFEFIVLPKDEWNKIYFDMTQVLAQAPATRFIFAIRGGIPVDDNGQFTMEEAFVYLDNIKVITF